MANAVARHGKWKMSVMVKFSVVVKCIYLVIISHPKKMNFPSLLKLIFLDVLVV